MATDFLLTLNDALGKYNLSSASFRVATFAEELKIMHLIINGMLCLYAFVKDSIEDQLKNVSADAHMLFALHREYNGKLFPNQLYHDLQST